MHMGMHMGMTCSNYISGRYLATGFIAFHTFHTQLGIIELGL